MLSDIYYDLEDLVEDHPLAIGLGIAGGVLNLAAKRGPYHALRLAFSSARWRAPVNSARTADVKLVRSKLSSLEEGRFLSVYGPNGVGKSCVVDTVLQQRPGVLRFDVPNVSREDDILNQIFSALSGDQRRDFRGNRKLAKSVLNWYNLFGARYPALIVLRADNTRQCRSVAEKLTAFGFQVLLDGRWRPWNNYHLWIEDDPIVEMDYADRNLLFGIPEFQGFFKKLEDCDLKEEFWQIIGGRLDMVSQLVAQCSDKKDIREDVVRFLWRSLEFTFESLHDGATETPGLGDVLEGFQPHSVPTNPSVRFVLRVGLEDMSRYLKEAVVANVNEKESLLKRIVSQVKKSSEVGKQKTRPVRSKRGKKHLRGEKGDPIKKYDSAMLKPDQ